MTSLAQLAHREIPLSQVLQLEKAYIFPPYLSSWEVWRERAVKEFKIPPAYFDLPLYENPPREISGKYRYLEILTKFKLTPEAGAYLTSQGVVGGIYESLAGVVQAVRRDDERMVLYFVQRLRPEVRELLTKPEVRKFSPIGLYSRFRTRAYRVLWTFLFQESGFEGLYFRLFPWEVYTENVSLGLKTLNPKEYNRRTFLPAMSYLISQGNLQALEATIPWFLRTRTLKKERAKEIFIAVLRSGREDFLDYAWELIKNFYFEKPLPSLTEVIGETPFAQPIEVPIDEKIKRAAVYGGNKRIFSFVMVLSHSDEVTNIISTINKGSYAHPNPVGYYQILSTVTSTKGGKSLHDVDLNKLLWNKVQDKDGFVERVLEENLGNIDMLLAFIPYLGERINQVLPKLFSLTKYFFPLSYLILQDYKVDI